MRPRHSVLHPRRVVHWLLMVCLLLTVSCDDGDDPTDGGVDGGDADVPNDGGGDAWDGDLDGELDGDPDAELDGEPDGDADEEPDADDDLPTTLGTPCDGGDGACPEIPDEGGISLDLCCQVVGATIELAEDVSLTVVDGGELRLSGSHLRTRGDLTVEGGGRVIVDECSEIVFVDDPNAGIENRDNERHRRLLVEPEGYLQVGAAEDDAPEGIRGSICALNESVVLDDPVEECGGELACLSMRVEPPTCERFEDLPGNCGPPTENPLDELHYFELAVLGSLVMNGAQVTFVGLHRDDGGAARWCGSGNADLWWVERPVLSGIQIHPHARARIHESTVAYTEAHGIYIMEDFSGATAEEVTDRIAAEEQMLDVEITGSDVHHAGLGDWCHPYVGSDGVFLTDVPTVGERFERCPLINRCPRCQFISADISQCDECSTRGCDPLEECGDVDDLGLNRYPPPWEPDECGGYGSGGIWNPYNNPTLGDREDRLPRPLRDVLSECVGLHAGDSRLQQLCEEEHMHQALRLEIHDSTFHHNSRGGLRLQSLYTIPSVVGNDITENGNECHVDRCADCVVHDVDGCHVDLPDHCAECDPADCGNVEPSDRCAECCRCGRCLFALGDECSRTIGGDTDVCNDGSGEQAPMSEGVCDWLYRYHSETRHDATADDDALVRYRRALGPSSSTHGSYGILAYFMFTGELRHNDIHRHTGSGLIHSKGASWIIEYNRFWHNMAALTSG